MRLTSLSLFISSPSFSLWFHDTCHLMPFTQYSLLDQFYFFTACLFIAHLKFTNKIHQLFTDYLLRLPYSELLETHLFRSRANRRLVYMLRKPASWLVAVCERSENRGCGGGWLPKGNEISPCPCVEREKTEHFAGLCTTRQFADGGVSIPPRSAFLVAGETMRMYWKIQ